MPGGASTTGRCRGSAAGAREGTPAMTYTIGKTFTFAASIDGSALKKTNECGSPLGCPLSGRVGRNGRREPGDELVGRLPGRAMK